MDIFGMLYNKAEPVRNAAEAARKAAEATRAAFYDGFSSQLAEIGTFPATNIVADGNFGSTTGISATNVTATAASNKLRLVATGTGEHYADISESSNFTAGHTYYACIKISGIIGRAKFEMFNRTSDGNYEFNEQILTADGIASLVLPITSKYASPYARLRMRVMDATGAISYTAGTEEASWEYLSLLDLTAMFSAGNEPTATQMSAYLANLPNRWVDGTVNLSATDKLLGAVVDMCDSGANLLDAKSKLMVKYTHIPQMRFYGSMDGMSADTTKILRFGYYGAEDFINDPTVSGLRESGVLYTGYAKMKWQGSSSLSFPKKNYTITLYSNASATVAQNITFRTAWGAHNKYCMKANFIDPTQCRNVVAAKLWGDCVRSREETSESYIRMHDLPNAGAVDGYPVLVFLNDQYIGLYTMNIPKDAWMFGMIDGEGTNVVLGGEAYVAATDFSGPAAIDDTDWTYEVEPADKSGVAASFNAIYTALALPETTHQAITDKKAAIELAVDIYSIIDYAIFIDALCLTDNTGKNQLFATYDGVKWIMSAYDMDTAFGMHWSGTSYYESDHDAGSNNLLNVIKRLYSTEYDARKIELMAGVLSETNIIMKLFNFAIDVPQEAYRAEMELWPDQCGANANAMQQIISFVTAKAQLFNASKLAEIGTFPTTNLITRGNFPSASVVYTTNVTATAASNKLRLVATGNGEHYAEKVISSVVTAGHTYYARVKISGIIGRAKFEMLNRTSDGNYESAETILTGNGVASIVFSITSQYSNEYACLRMRIMDASGALSFTAGIEEASWEYMLMIDLTDLFFAGNEPTAAQMDAYMVYIANGWFDGTSNLAIASALFPAAFSAYKAFVPGNWITPTMLNGATNTGNLAYRKNAFGQVEFRGAFTPASTGVSSFTLPAGYRPPNGTTFALINSVAQVIAVGVYNDGRVVPWTSSANPISCDGMRIITV